MNELFPGQIVNQRYRIIRRLGRGGASRVFLVEDRLIEDRRVALKTLLRDDDTAAGLPEFRREFETLTRLSHPNLVEVYDFGILAGAHVPFFTAEFVEGVELATAGRRLSAQNLCECLAQVCRALDYLHTRGLVHGDLKPANILVTRMQTREPLVKLLDFGFAERIGGVATGVTLQYQAPEVLSGQPQTVQADLYSLGVTLYEATTYRLPFDAPTPDQLIDAQLHQPPPPPKESDPELSRRLWPVMKNLLAKDPDERYESAPAVVRAVNEVTGLSFEVDPTTAMPDYLLGSPFVGREHEFALLEEEIKRLKSGRRTGRRGVLVHGPPGIGKSRLLQEFRYSCQFQGVGFFSANCRRDAGEAYEPLSLLLRQALAAAGIDPRRGPADLISLCRLAAREMDTEPVDVYAQLDPSQVTVHLAEVVLRFLSRLAQRSPFVLVVDDFQWVNEPTTGVLGYVIRNATNQPFQVFLVYREEEVESPAAALIDELVTREAPTIPVPPLASGELTALVEGALGTSGFAGSFLSRFAAHTGGNPFFALELLRLYVQERALRREHDVWRVDDALLTEDAPIPASVRELVSRRVGTAAAPEREVVEALAVLARPASPELLAAMLGTTPGDVLVRCIRLGEAGLTVRDPAREVIELTHSEIGRVLYASLGTARKRLLHARAGAALESLSPEPSRSVVQLAMHFLRAEDSVRGRRYGVEAAEVLQSSSANREARDLYQQVLSLSGSEDPPTEVRLRAGLAEVHQFLGEPEEAVECAQTGLALAEKLGDVAGQIRFHQVLAAALDSTGRFAEAGRHLSRGCELLGDYTPPSRTAAELLEARGESALRQGHADEALKLLNAALAALGSDLENARAAAIYTSMAVAHHHRQQIQYALACLERSMSIRRRIDDREGLSRSVNNKGNIHLFRGEYEQALDCYRQSLEIKQELGNVEGTATSYYNVGHVHSLRGEHALARKAYEESLSMRRRIGDRLGQLSSLLGIANACNQTGDYPAALEAARRYLALEQDLGSDPSPAPLLEQAATFVELGQVQEAEKTMQRALTLAERHQDPREKALSRLQLARVYAARGDLSGAEAALAEARELAEGLSRELNETACLTAVLLEGVRTALRRKDHAGAERLLQEAERLDAAGDSGSTTAELLRLKAAALPPAETATALATFERAAKLAQRMGTPETLWRAKWGAARIYQQKRRYAAALDCYETALSVVHRVCARLADDAQVRGYLQVPERRELLESLQTFSRFLEEAVEKA